MSTRVYAFDGLPPGCSVRQMEKLIDRFHTVAGGVYVILFFAGFWSGYSSGEIVQGLLVEPAELYYRAGLFAAACSLFTPLLVGWLSGGSGVAGYLKNAGLQFLLNISVFGANGLFVVLLLNDDGRTCELSRHAVERFENITDRRKHTVSRYALVYTGGLPYPIRFAGEPRPAPRMDVCIAPGRFGISIIRSKELVYDE